MSSPVRRLEGKVALITGSANGIGRAMARRFSAEGAALVLVDIAADALRSVADGLAPAPVEAIVADVSDEMAIGGAVERAFERFGRLDVLVNDAYFSVNLPVTELDPRDWQRTFDVCVSAIYYACRAAIPRMQSRGGSIINISSVHANTTVAGFPAYAAAKGAVLSLTRQLAIEYGPDGIRANAICPGFIATDDLTARVLTDPIKARAVVESTPLRRPGTPDDIASVALFLASDDAAFVTGQAITADGGMSAELPMMVLRPDLRARARIDPPNP